MSKSKPSPSEDPFATIPPRESFDAFPSLAAFPENAIAFLTGKAPAEACPEGELVKPVSQPAAQSTSQPAKQPETPPVSQPQNQPASLSATHKARQKASQSASLSPSQTTSPAQSLSKSHSINRTSSPTENPSQDRSSSLTLGRAKVGDRLNDNQRRVLDLLLATKPYIVKFRDIAQALAMREASVRTVMRRLDALGFLSFRKARDGNLQGVGVTFNQPVVEQYQQDRTLSPSTSLTTGLSSSHKTNQTQSPSISREKDQSPSQPISEPHSQSASHTPPLKIEKKEYLSIEAMEGWDEAFLELMWPRVFAAGLRQEQLDQAAAARQKLGKALDRDLLALSLDRAEWELETQGKLVDLQSGEPVRNAAAYIYTALARWGVLRAHPQYVSREQAEAEAAVDALRRRQEALDTLENLRFEQYRAELTPQELESILQGFPGGSKDAWIKAYWRKNVREAETGQGGQTPTTRKGTA
ncbi:hypothetical protein DMR_p1_00610 (plasmid) [Solidesulfovibrio magneticus RS-1]|uniref:Uncharacterized protein n=1 Tax=Solidesulfovibrio magneticus (strain ATCC 700980 / DSM 13731 / RS-1) TaxID=573370 RepID=C4XUM6_SOLM1|nr:hypothetical protein DMR_p1_00610 [Solidesulfovibrio magneticus RS-1]